MKTIFPLLLLSLALSACAGRTPSLPAPTRLIDAHTHLDEVWDSGDVSEFQRSGVVGVVAHAPMGKPLPPPPKRALPFPVKLCAAAVPDADRKSIEEAIKEKRVSCLKIYLGYIKRWASDPVYRPFYEMAERHNVPVVFHTGDTFDKMGHVKYADPLTVDEIATRYPKVKFLLAHLGNPWYHSAAEVAYKNDNVYLDTSALLLEDLSTRPPEVLDELITRPLRWMFYYVENPKKFLFGTDWPLTRIGPYVTAIQRAIPEAHWQAVFHDNAAEFFGFPKP